MIPGLDINLVGEDGNTPLMIVCDKGFNEIVKTIIICPEVNMHHVNNNGENAIMLACKNGHIEVVEELLKNNNRNELDLNCVNKDGNSALSLAVGRNEISVVKYLLINFGNILAEHIINNAYRIAEENNLQNMIKIISLRGYSKSARSAQ